MSIRKHPVRQQSCRMSTTNFAILLSSGGHLLDRHNFIRFTVATLNEQDVRFNTNRYVHLHSKPLRSFHGRFLLNQQTTSPDRLARRDWRIPHHSSISLWLSEEVALLSSKLSTLNKSACDTSRRKKTSVM